MARFRGLCIVPQKLNSELKLKSSLSQSRSLGFLVGAFARSRALRASRYGLKSSTCEQV